MRPQARCNKRVDSTTLAIVTGIIVGVLYPSLRMLVPNAMAAGVTLFVALTVYSYFGGLFHGRARHVYAGWLLIWLLISFLAGYMVSALLHE